MAERGFPESPCSTVGNVVWRLPEISSPKPYLGIQKPTVLGGLDLQIKGSEPTIL